MDYLLELVDEADKDKDGKIDYDEFEFMGKSWKVLFWHTLMFTTVRRIKQRIPMSESHLEKVGFCCFDH